MFGGLELKGAAVTAAPAPEKDDEKESSAPATGIATASGAASGFSFMSSVAASEPTVSEPAAAPAASSGFSFMSSATSAADVVPEEQSSSDNSNPPTDTTASASASASVAPSAFSFMGGATTTATESAGDNENETKEMDEDVAEAENEPNPSQSGFGFLSSETTTTTTTAVEENNEEEQPSSDSGFSSFNFLSSTLTDTPAPILPVSNELPSSGFGLTETTAPPPPPPSTTTTTTAPQSSTPNRPGKNNDSIFSMLSSNLGQPTEPQAQPPVPVPVPPSPMKETTSTSSSSMPAWGTTSTSLPKISSIPTTSTSTLSSTPATTTNMLLQPKSSQPTGAGIIFGGAVKPRTVKKRARAKKIGVGASTTTTTAPVLPEPTSYTSTSASASATTSASNNQEGEEYGNISDSRTLSVEAEEAATRAEEFISNKMSPTSNSNSGSSYMGRYSGDNSIVEDYGSSGGSAAAAAGEETESSTSKNIEKEQSEEYKKAKAAAENAKNFTSTNTKPPVNNNHNHRKMGGFMGGGMTVSGFFKRSFAGHTNNNSHHGGSSGSNHGSGSNHDSGHGNSARSSPTSNSFEESTSTSSHYDATNTATERNAERPKPKEWKVPTYGSPNESSVETEQPHYNNDDHNHNDEEDDHDHDHDMRQRREEEIRQELELERERKEKKRQDMMEEQRREKELMQKREAEKRQRLEEERRKKLEEVEEERRRKLEEEEAKRRTPIQELNKLIHQFSLVSQNTTCSIGELRQERTMLLEKRSSAEKQERLAIQQITQAETQQMDAAEQEDFDLADRLAAVIEQHKREKDEHSRILKDIGLLIDNLDSRRVEKGQKVLSCFEDVQFQLKEFLTKQENSDIKDSSELLKKFESDTKRLAAENERLTADLKNIERDEGFVKEEQEVLEATIAEQTGDIEVLRDAASVKLDGINDEIEELRKQLAEKEMKAAEVKMELHGHEESIENVRSTFSRQLTRLVKKQTATNESRKEWESEEISYKNSRTEHEAEVTAHSEALVAHDNLITKIKEESSIAKQLAEIIAQEVVVVKVGNDDAPDDEVTAAQAEVMRCEASADEAKQVLMASKALIDNLKDEISTMKVRLPILEAEKKQAASKRDFKAAGKASKAIKEMVAKKERCEEELSGEAIERQVAAQKEVDACIETLKEKSTISHEKEKEGGRKRMIQLVKKIIKLEKLREDICGTGEEEEGEGECITVVGGFVLDSEIAALVTEGEELGIKFGGWDEIMIEIADAANEEGIEDETTTDNGNEDGVETQPSLGESSEVITDGEVAEAQLAEENYTEVDSADIDEADKEEAMKRYVAILAEIDEIDSEIETAIEEEEYDAAAELDDKILRLKDELKLLDLSDSEVEAAKAMELESADDSKASSHCTEKSYDMVSSKSEGNADEETEVDGDEETEAEAEKE